MNPPQSFLSKVGTVATTVVKHVPTRGLLWGVIGFVVGAVAVALSFGVGLLVMDRGALILGYLVVIPLALPPLGFVLFGMHGLHRGAARAMLELDRKFGLVAYLIDRVLSRLQQHVGTGLSNLPLQRLEQALKETVSSYLGSSEEDDGRGMLGYVVRRARKALVPRIEAYLLSAYREEQRADGSGGGVSIEKVRARALQATSERLSEIVMSPLNKQLAVFMTLYVLLAGGWWFWIFLIGAAFSKLTGS